MNGSEWLTIADVGDRLGLSEGTVYLLLKSGRLRSYKVGAKGGRYRVSEAHVAAYLASVETDPDRAPAPPARPRPARPEVLLGRPDGLPLRHLKLPPPPAPAGRGPGPRGGGRAGPRGGCTSG
jgi:excisionase family DNA binding protein